MSRAPQPQYPHVTHAQLALTQPVAEAQLFSIAIALQNNAYDADEQTCCWSWRSDAVAAIEMYLTQEQ